MSKRLELTMPELFGNRIALAFSGGRDSVCLAGLFLDAGVDFFAVNVEHGIRGEASVSDTEFAREFCRGHGIEFCTFSVDSRGLAKEKGYTIEQAARELRYRVFDGLIAEGKCDYIALAHHRDDQVETVVMRVLRGTGLRGLEAMKPVSGKYIRPLLDVSRAEIDEYVAQKGLAYVDDETNDDDKYSRNFLRAEISKIKERYPAFDQSILRLARSAAEAEAFISGFVPEPEIIGGEAVINCADLKEKAVGKRLILKACAACGVHQDIEERHFELIYGLAGCESGKRIELPHGLDVHKEADNLVFAVRNAKRDADGMSDGALVGGLPFAEDIQIGDIILSVGNVTLNKSSRDEMRGAEKGVLFVDGDKLPRDAVLRFRREGDRIEKFGGGTKSLGDFLTDKKVPLRKRGGLIVCAQGNEVLFVAGVEISEKLKVTKETKNIIKITEG